jgi:hypothetical protein
MTIFTWDRPSPPLPRRDCDVPGSSRAARTTVVSPGVRGPVDESVNTGFSACCHGWGTLCPLPWAAMPSPAGVRFPHRLALTRPYMLSGRRGLSGWPVHGAAAKDVGVRVEHRLAGTRAGVEHQPVPGVADTLGDCYLMCLVHHLGEQPVPGFSQRCRVLVVRFGNDQNMDGRLRVDIAERNRAITFTYTFRRQLTDGNLAEKAIMHALIVAVAPPCRETV